MRVLTLSLSKCIILTLAVEDRDELFTAWYPQFKFLLFIIKWLLILFFFNYSYQTEDEDLKRALQLSLQGEFIRGNMENAL